MIEDGRQVWNRYRDDVAFQHAGAVGSIRELSELMDAAVRAFQAGAWVSQSNAAMDAYKKLLSLQSSARSTAQSVEDEFDDALSRQPHYVDESSWQAKW